MHNAHSPRCTIYLVRHGQAAFNRDHRILGQIESPLTQQGIEEATRLHDELETVSFSAIYTSSYERTVKTAHEIIGTRPVLFFVEEDLKERGFGPLEARPEREWGDLKAQQAQMFAALSPTDQWRHKFAPSIESNAEVFNRVEPTIRRVATTHLGETVLIVAHAGPIRMLLIGLGFFSEQELPDGSFKTGTYAVLTFDGQRFQFDWMSAAGLSSEPRTV